MPVPELSPILPPMAMEPFKPTETSIFPQISIFPERPTFLPPKPIPHSHIISPSSIPNPNPSVTTMKHMEPGYPSYGGYLYSIPGYSAFQPISYQGPMQTHHEANYTVHNPVLSPEYVPYRAPTPIEPIVEEQVYKHIDKQPEIEVVTPQTDFEDHFTTEIIPTVTVSETEKSNVSKLSITSLIQGSGATVTIPSQISSQEVKKKPAERFSLKTSIPISKIDMKCVSNPPDSMFQNSINKKPAFKIPNLKNETSPRVEIQSNIVIKTATIEPEVTPTTKPALTTGTNNIKPAPITETNNIKPALTTETDNIKPAPTTGTNNIKLAPTTGTNSIKPAPTTGTNSIKPAPTTETNSTKPAPTTGTNSIKPAPTTANNSIKPAPPTANNSIKPALPTANNSIKPAPPTAHVSIKPVPTKGTNNVKSPPITGNSILKPAPTTGTNITKPAPTTGTNNIKPTPTSGTNIVNSAQITGTSNNKPASITGTNHTKPAPTTGTNNVKPAPITGTNNIKPAQIIGTNNNKPASITGTSNINLAPTTGTNNNKPAPTTGTNNSKPAPTTGTHINKPAPTTGTNNIKLAPTTGTNNINALINAAEAISKTESRFWNTEQIGDTAIEIQDTAPVVTTLPSSITAFNTINREPKVTFPNKPPDGTFNEQKNQIVFIQNKKPSKPKMMLTIQQQNPQVLLQRTSFESKNLQPPSRLSNQSKKSKEDVVGDSTASKVVALKRLHQENCDENDFENLITENQIYGNKIVVKEKSQGTQQEQDLKNNNKVTDKQVQADTKNVVLQPNFLYLSNVQFPANIMMIKNNKTKINQINDSAKAVATTTDSKMPSEVITTTNATDANPTVKSSIAQNVVVSKDIHVLKSTSNVLQTISNKNNKTDIVFQTNQKVIMSPQLVYQMPMIVETDNKVNNREYPKILGQKVEYSKPTEQKPNDKLFIACPYQMDSMLQPKIVITNIRTKRTKTEEVSSLDIYEKRKRLRRLKHLSNRENKEGTKTEPKKGHDKQDALKNIITPEKMDIEICKEFVSTKTKTSDVICESDSDYGEEELKDYMSIIKDFGNEKENNHGKEEFLAGLRLATRNAYKERELVIQEKMLRADAVASAYIAAGRLDRLCSDVYPDVVPASTNIEKVDRSDELEKEEGTVLQRKQVFFSQLKLRQVSPQYKEGYEKSWQEIIKERNRRYGVNGNKVTPISKGGFDPNCTLQMLTEIKKCVNDTNNIIKKRLDPSDENSNECSIRALAEKNFSELDRLSKMADKSVKLLSGQNTTKRDLNPGFDSENIQKPVLKLEPSIKNYPNIKIPSYSKTVFLKTQENPVITTNVPCVEDQEKLTPQEDQPVLTCEEGTKEIGCQANDDSWMGTDPVTKSFRAFDAVRKKELTVLQRRNTTLRVEGAMITCQASRESDRARALLAERKNLALEENRIKTSIQKLYAAVEALRKC